MKSENYKSVIIELKEQITREYNVKILKRMMHHKLQYVKKQSKRADFNSHRFNAGFKDPDVLRCNLDKPKSHIDQQQTPDVFTIK